MTAVRAVRRWSVVVTALVALSACRSATEADRSVFAVSTAGPPLVVGRVTDVTRYGVLVTTDSLSGDADASVRVSIPREPHSVYVRSGAKASVSDVVIGSRIRVWTTDAVIFTHPALVTARLVVLDP